MRHLYFGAAKGGGSLRSSEHLVARRSGPLTGRARVPGDKSISHRALILGALCVGDTPICGLLDAGDVARTAAALQAMGATVTRDGPDRHVVSGVGVGGLMQPAHDLDLGNSGTSTRLLLGLVASHDIEVGFTGDASLSRRPMRRVLEPLQAIGARVTAGGDTLPLRLRGARDPEPITYRLPVPSAQVKSAILLAGLNTPGITTVIEPQPTRDHTERMLTRFGARVEIGVDAGGARRIALAGQPELSPCAIEVPGDPSSAAFLVVAALIVPGSDIVVENVMMNPTRAGLIETLQDMGGDIEPVDRREAGGEPVADLRVRASRLSGVEVPAWRAPSQIDEYPVLAVAAAFAEGTTRMRGLAELRVKESDRLAAIVDSLGDAGVRAESGGDDLTVTGGGVTGGSTVTTRLDHRLAMAALVMGLASDRPVAIDDASPIATSFTGFVPTMRGLGAMIDADEE